MKNSADIFHFHRNYVKIILNWQIEVLVILNLPTYKHGILPCGVIYKSLLMKYLFIEFLPIFFQDSIFLLPQLLFLATNNTDLCIPYLCPRF